MAETLGNWVVKIGLNTEGLQKGASSAISTVTTLGKNFAVFANGIPGLVIGGLKAVSDGIMGVANDIDRLAKDSRRLGVSTGFLSGLGVAALDAGIDVATMTKSMQKFVRELPEGTDVEAAFLEISDVMESIQDPVQRSQMLFDRFGKTGQELGTLFENGSQGIRKSVQAARELGVALTSTQAGAVETMNDAFERIGTATKGIFSQLLASVAPVATELAHFFSNSIQSLLPLVQSIGNSIAAFWKEHGTTVKAVFSGMVDFIRGLVDVAIGVFEVIGGVLANFVRSFSGWFAQMGLATVDWRGVAIEACRLVAQAFAFFFDVIRAGAGIFAQYAVAPISDFIALAVEGLEYLGAVAEGSAERFRTFADGAAEIGASWRTSFGESIAASNAFFDNLQRRQFQAASEQARPITIGAVNTDRLDEALKAERERLTGVTPIQSMQESMRGQVNRNLGMLNIQNHVQQFAANRPQPTAERITGLSNSLQTQIEEQLRTVTIPQGDLLDSLQRQIENIREPIDITADGLNRFRETFAQLPQELQTDQLRNFMNVMGEVVSGNEQRSALEALRRQMESIREGASITQTQLDTFQQNLARLPEAMRTESLRNFITTMRSVMRTTEEVARVEALREGNRLRDLANNQNQRFRSPLESFRNTARELQEILQFQADTNPRQLPQAQENFALAMQEAMQGLAQQVMPEQRIESLSTRGSRGAAEATLRTANQGGPLTLENLTREANRQRQEQIRLAEQNLWNNRFQFGLLEG